MSAPKEPINFKSFRTDFTKAVAELSKKYNIDMKIAGIRYSAANFSARLECNIIGKDTKEIATYKLFQSINNLPLLGTTFVSRGEKYQIVGMNTRRSRYPILCTSILDGTIFKFSEETVRLSCGIKDKNYTFTKKN
jgi:hypothetical protein